MRVLLRNLDTGAYYAGGGRWVRAQSQAYDFVEVAAAHRFCQKAHWERVEVFLALSAPGLRSRFSRCKGRENQAQAAA